MKNCTALRLGFAILLGALLIPTVTADTNSTNPIPLRVTELMYHAPASEAPAIDEDEADFIELFNACPDPITLADYEIDDGVTFDFADSAFPTLNPGEYLLVVENLNAFETRYANALPVAGQFSGGLSNGGETIRIRQKSSGDNLEVTYGSSRNWPIAAEGVGHSLIPLVTEDQEGRLKLPLNWRHSTFIGGSPGEADPEPNRDLVLNEISPHTDFSDPEFPEYDSNDWIELRNRTSNLILMDDWFLSDNPNDLLKWAVPDGTDVPADGYKVFEEIGNPSGGTPGFHFPITSGFGINKLGERIYLSHFPPGSPGRIVDAVQFKAIESVRSWGRFPDGDGQWHHMATTRSQANLTRVPDAVINEVMYRPPSGDNALEFIELHNPTAFELRLFDFSGPWKLKGDVTMTLPANLTLAAADYLLLVPFDPVTNTAALATFTTTYGLSPDDVRIVGPWEGSLPNGSGRVALERAEEPDGPAQDPGEIVIDEILYADRAPWPTSADGGGDSLQRGQLNFPGSDPVGWGAIAPTPGARGLNPAALAINNLIHPFATTPGEVGIVFPSDPGANYDIEIDVNLEFPNWFALTNLTATASETTVPLDASIFGDGPIYFRVQQVP